MCCVCQGADPEGEGGGGHPSAAGGQQVRPGGAAAGLCRRRHGQGRRVGGPVRGDVGQDEGQRGQGTKTTTTQRSAAERPGSNQQEPENILIHVTR